MKRITGLTFFTLAFVFLTSFTAFSADVAKIGIVDFQKIIKDSSAGKLLQKKIKDKGAEFSKKLKNMQNEIIEIEKNLKRESMVLSQEKRDEKGREYRIKVNDFNQAKKKLQYDLKALENKEVDKMQKAVFEIVQKIGKKEGYLLVVEKKVAGVIYNPASIDITDKVIKEYNKISAKILLMHGWDDPMATPEQVLSLADELTSMGADWQIHAYGNTMHAFTNPAADDVDMGTVYNEDADRRSWQSLQLFLAEIF